MPTAPGEAVGALRAAVALRRGGGPGPTDAALTAALDLLGRRDGAPWRVAVRGPGADLLAGHPARGSVVEVVGVDRPLVVDTVASTLRRDGEAVLDLATFVVGVERDGSTVVAVGPARAAERAEFVLQAELDRALSPDEAAAIEVHLDRVMDRLVEVTDDHRAMRQRLQAATIALAGAAAAGTSAVAADPRTGGVAGGGGAGSPEAVDDAIRTVRWLLDGNAVLLGLRRRPPSPDAPDLGLARRDPDLDGGATARVGLDHPVRISRLPHASPLVRPDPVLRLDLWTPDATAAGGVETLWWIASRRAAGTPLASVPMLRRKLDELLARRDILRGSHDEQHVTLLFQSLPEDDLFGLDVDELDAVLGDLLSEDRDATVRVALRPLRAAHAVAALLTMPADRWTRPLRRRIERFLAAQLDGHQVDVSVTFVTGTDAVTARIVVHVAADADLPDPLEPIARELRLLCRSWEEHLAAALAADERIDDDRAAALAERWGPRLPAAYRDTVEGRDAVADVLALDEVATLAAAGDEGVRVWFAGAGERGGPARMGLVVDRAVELSALLPALESLGLWVTDEARWPVGDGISVHRIGVRVRGTGGDPAPAPTEEGTGRLADAVVALVAGRAEVDDLNRLVLHGGLAVDDVAVLRAYRRYRHQVAPTHDEAYVDEVLVGHPAVARLLLDLWRARVDDPGAPDRAERAEAAAAAVSAACDALTRLDHDRILRGLAGTIEATLRTNRLLRPAGPLALKLDPAVVPDAPVPRPYREIFVTGARVEGVHLRAGPVARGGLRASDRDQDYRSEVLDLMRTQVLKNAVIVPTGAKGGFVGRGPVDPDVPRGEAVAAAYDEFVGALLDVTDDVRDGRVVAVPGRWDGDDPYLVVAADKGTAAFSDRANAIAEARGFWLGDAFASGGSQGYDHKALGITARGAWVAVRAHLRSLGLDPDVDEITVVGVGDMSGDVFGNGMLRSDRIRLVAAFDHRHVFLDPDPDPAVSFAERRRLFELPRSSWADYDPALISEGGGVHDRAAKAVPLSDRVRAVLRVDAAELTPAELIRAVLGAPVDLLYFGGIGTYVRASTEDDAAIDDRANADVRVPATDVRARVVGEGANLAMTQRSRVELARRGSRVNMDAIDNAAGVDCSDHEVNVKILLADAERDGRIDRPERDALLAAHADDVVAAVLADCAAQSDALDRAERAAPGDVDGLARVLRELVADEVLDPDVEALPDEAELAARAAAGAGLTRPELAVLLAGEKRRVAADLLASGAPDDPALRDALVDYFPPALAERFDDLLDRHRLRRELVASEVANDLVDHLGLTAASALRAELDVGTAEIALAYRVARAVVGSPARWEAMAAGRVAVDPTIAAEPLDGGDLLAGLLRGLTRDELIRRRGRERAGGGWDAAARIAEDRPVADALAARPDVGPEAEGAVRQRALRLAAGGLAPDVAEATARLPALEVVPDVAAVARDLGLDPVAVAAAFAAVEHRLGLTDLWRRTDALPGVGEWAATARRGLLDDLIGIRREAARRVLADRPDLDPDDAVAAHLDRRAAAVAEASAVRRRLAVDVDAGFDALTVAVRAVRRAVL